MKYDALPQTLNDNPDVYIKHKNCLDTAYRVLSACKTNEGIIRTTGMWVLSRNYEVLEIEPIFIQEKDLDGWYFL